jgi:hypothetical protein
MEIQPDPKITVPVDAIQPELFTPDGQANPEVVEASIRSQAEPDEIAKEATKIFDDIVAQAEERRENHAP